MFANDRFRPIAVTHGALVLAHDDLAVDAAGAVGAGVRPMMRRGWNKISYP